MMQREIAFSRKGIFGSTLGLILGLDFGAGFQGFDVAACYCGLLLRLVVAAYCCGLLLRLAVAARCCGFGVEEKKERFVGGLRDTLRGCVAFLFSVQVVERLIH